MADDDAIAGGTGLEALVEASKDGPEAKDSSEAQSAPEKAAGAKKRPAKPKKPPLTWDGKSGRWTSSWRCFHWLTWTTKLSRCQ